MTTLRVLTVTFLTAVLAMPAMAEMGTARGTDRTARPNASPADRASEVSEASGGGNLIIINEDGVPMTSDGRVVILQQVNERGITTRQTSEAQAHAPNPAFSVREYREGVEAERPALRLAGHDDRTTASVAVSISGADRDRRTVERSGLIYSRRVVREGVNGSALVYEYRVTPTGTKFLYYRDSGQGYGYLRRIDDRDNRRWDAGHPHHPRSWHRDGRGDAHDFGRHPESRHDDSKSRAGRLIITTED